MKMITPIVATTAFFTATPVVAQEEKARETTATEATEAVEIAPPPPILVAPAPPDYKPKYPRDPQLVRYRIFQPTDYPIEAWRNNEEGRVRYRVDVDAEGNAKSCEVTEHSASQSLADTTCAVVMERAAFRPAMAAENEPVSGVYEGQYNWRKREPQLPQMSITYRYRHGADGKSTDCEFLKLEDIPEKMRKQIERDLERNALCKLTGFGSGRGIPYRDEAGNPVAKVVTVKFDVQLEDPVD